MNWRSRMAARACVLIASMSMLVAAAAPGTGRASWKASEVEVLASLGIDRLPAPAPDPSNAVAANPAAAALGEALFSDTRLSRNDAVSCASCHDPGKGFQDGLPVGHGIGTGRRRSMPLVDAAYSPWLFWDGRKDSLWAQALGPLEDGAEHGGNRLRHVRQLAAHYARPYLALFGSLPDLARAPPDASPLGTPEQRVAWASLDASTRDAVNGAFANLGKAIAAYERTLRHPETLFDAYVRAVVANDPGATRLLAAEEMRGLRVFIGRGQCVSCHNGPLLTDQAFHNTGVPARPGLAPDHGRRAALPQVVVDEFNCAGPYSDAGEDQCAELMFMSKDDPALEGAFKTPGLRGVALRAPYMHAGQFATLEDVVRHYARAPAAPVGLTELTRRSTPHGRAPIRLSEQDIHDVVAFLGTLSPAAARKRSE